MSQAPGSGAQGQVPVPPTSPKEVAALAAERGLGRLHAGRVVADPLGIARIAGLVGVPSPGVPVTG